MPLDFEAAFLSFKEKKKRYFTNTCLHLFYLIKIISLISDLVTSRPDFDECFKIIDQRPMVKLQENFIQPLSFFS